jgi:hypothetical protein
MYHRSLSTGDVLSTPVINHHEASDDSQERDDPFAQHHDVEPPVPPRPAQHQSTVPPPVPPKPELENNNADDGDEHEHVPLTARIGDFVESMLLRRGRKEHPASPVPHSIPKPTDAGLLHGKMIPRPTLEGTLASQLSYSDSPRRFSSTQEESEADSEVRTERDKRERERERPPSKKLVR